MLIAVCMAVRFQKLEIPAVKAIRKHSAYLDKRKFIFWQRLVLWIHQLTYQRDLGLRKMAQYTDKFWGFSNPSGKEMMQVKCQW